jgi:transaldolase
MKLFIDTANLEEIRDVLERGVVQGVTTNPSLLSKEPQADFYSHIQKIADICTELAPGIPLSVEVFAEKPDDMIEQAQEIMKTVEYSNLIIKVPVGYDELRVISELKALDIDVNCTCCFTATQLQLAALSGARYVSLFYNRALDSQINAIEILQRTRNFIDFNELDCEIIAGSIRNAYDLEDCWDAGCDIVTAGLPVIKKSVSHLKTDESVNGFLKDFATWIK